VQALIAGSVVLVDVVQLDHDGNRRLLSTPVSIVAAHFRRTMVSVPAR